VHYNNQGLDLWSRVSVVLPCVRMYPHLPLERTMGFFILWWLGEVSNFPQGQREAPPTPLMCYFYILDQCYRKSKIITARCCDASGTRFG
jgi:hypothetical protein